MRTFVVIPCVLVLISGLGSHAQNDGGCTATGQQPYDYKQALCMSFLFYEAQRSGYLPLDQRIKWRGDSALHDGSDVEYDLVGGYFDAADFEKYTYPLAFTTTTLSWGLLSYSAGYEKAGQTEYARTTIRRATDYILKCHTNPYELYGQVGDPELDRHNWGRPEDIIMTRPSYKINKEAPGSDLAGETAAALASSYLVFKDIDSTYANSLLELAKEMFDFADQFRDIYTNSIPEASTYESWSYYGDDLCWAALWMYRATNEKQYMDRALEFIDEFFIMNMGYIFNYEDKKPGIYALMAELHEDPIYKNKLDEYVQHMINDMPYTPKGLLYINEWNMLSLSAGAAFIGARAASLDLNTNTYNAWAQSQLDYILGSSGHSFVVGFGVKPPLQPHHRAASCKSPPATCDYRDVSKPMPNPHVIFGAVISGPDMDDNWRDSREDYQHMMVSLEYNSCYSGLLAAMIETH